jgi:type IV pilus assembly protein PilO
MANFKLNNIYQWPRMTQMMVFGLVFAVTFYFGYQWDISALRINLSDSIQQEVELKQQIVHDFKKEDLIKHEISQFPGLLNQLDVWQKKLISYSQLPELLNEILKLGAANHLYFNMFDPGDEMKDGLYAKVPLKIRAVGSYQQLGEFISQVANMPVVIEVGDFSISSETRNDMLGGKLAQQAAQAGLLTGEFTFLIYHMIEKPKNGV